MSDPVEVSVWLKFGETTRVDYQVYPSGHVEFCVGGPSGSVLATDEFGLQRFIAHAEQALRALRDVIAHGDER